MVRRINVDCISRVGVGHRVVNGRGVVVVVSNGIIDIVGNGVVDVGRVGVVRASRVVCISSRVARVIVVGHRRVDVNIVVLDVLDNSIEVVVDRVIVVDDRVGTA